MSKLISFDFAIKYLLKDKSNYSIIEGFISAILKEQGYKPVKIIALLDTESNREEYSSKKSLADLIVEDEEHHKYIIEIERQEAVTGLRRCSSGASSKCKRSPPPEGAECLLSGRAPPNRTKAWFFHIKIPAPSRIAKFCAPVGSVKSRLGRTVKSDFRLRIRNK